MFVSSKATTSRLISVLVYIDRYIYIICPLSVVANYATSLACSKANGSMQLEMQLQLQIHSITRQTVREDLQSQS